ncbi:MAG: serine hydrolase domain-containing protein [Acidobacteriota bacterium]
MRNGRVLARLSFGLLLAATVLSPPLAAQVAVRTAPAAAAVAAPESVGLAPDLHARMDEGMQGIVDKGHLAGVVTLVARHGRVVQYKAYGKRDLASGAPMALDTIARIYSMTKPITGVAMLMLYEEGKWSPDDPIAKHIPAFAGLKVYAGANEAGEAILETPKRAPTMRDLMSHTAGFTYGLFGNTPVDKLYQAAQPLSAPSLQAFIDRMATLPLLYHPGERWVYSVGVDIQGYLVEKLSGQPFPDFLRTRIFEPLGMTDTAFYVPESKLDRLATIYTWSQEKGMLVPQPRPGGISEPPGLPSGGGGLYGTAADYFRFAQMLLNGGELDGTRLLKKATVDMMRTNVLDAQVLASKPGIGQARFSPAQGFGYDVAVVLDPAGLMSQVGKGTYWWWGIAGTWFWIDPSNDIVMVGIIQRQGGAPGAANHEEVARTAIYGALAKAAP